MLKKSITIMALLAFVAIGFVGFVHLTGDPNADKSPVFSTEFSQNSGVMDTIPPSGFPYPTVFNFNHSTNPTLNAGTVGALWFNGKYYFNRWNSTMVYRYNDNGPGGGPGTIADSMTYVGSCRDLACDGTFIYGGNASTTLYRFDPNTMATLKTFTLTGGQTRAIAWDPNRKGFWNTGFSGNIFLHDTNGVLVTQITSALIGKYGLAFDSTSTPGTAFLWVWDQTSTTQNGLYKYHIQTGALVNTYLFTLTGTQIGQAGGCEVVAKGSQLLLLCNYQNFALCGYKLADLGHAVPTGTWTEQTSGTTSALYSISAPNDNVAWAVGAAGIVYTTTNKGANWVAKTNPSTTDNYTVFAFDANNAIVTASGTTAYAYKTTNGGTNWTTVLTQVGGFFDDVQFKDANNGILYGDPVGGRWTIFKTTNAGTTWDSTGMYVATTAAGWNNSMYMNNNTIYFGTNNGTLVYSTNFGTSWTILTTLQANTYVTWFNTPSIGLTGGAELNVTTNGGANWTAMTSVGTGNISGITGASTSWWMTRQTTAVNYSSNNGTAWTAQYTAPAGNFFALTMSRAGATIWGVRSNGGISRYGQPLVGIGNGSTEAPATFSLSQNYPNPFNPTTKINYALPKSGLVTMKVYDILGKEVASLVNETKTAGNYTVEFNASNLSSGIYFYKISVNGFNEVKKMTLIK
ncbi:MAG: T9SS type A sorting domain-containing protein [Bacteroidetes bacterium]|nr:T9SS type A sorting domain-containing protein [Bacteroidota bacterium]